MPRICVNGAELHYEEAGSGPEAVVFAHGLGWSGRLFDGQVAALKARYRCITFDFRGQGRSEATEAGYDMDTLTNDAAALIEALGAAPCHFVGLSMGGFVGLRLAARRPELVRSLVLMGTSADAEPPENLANYRLLAFVVRWLGMRPVVGRVMKIYFGPKFLNDPAREVERAECRRRLTDIPSRAAAARAARGVFTRPAIDEEIRSIRAPTLILVGADDAATRPEKSRRIHERIAGSRLLVVPDAGHTVNVEAPEAVHAALAQFLAAVR